MNFDVELAHTLTQLILEIEMEGKSNVCPQFLLLWIAFLYRKEDATRRRRDTRQSNQSSATLVHKSLARIEHFQLGTG